MTCNVMYCNVGPGPDVVEIKTVKRAISHCIFTLTAFIYIYINDLFWNTWWRISCRLSLWECPQHRTHLHCLYDLISREEVNTTTGHFPECEENFVCTYRHLTSLTQKLLHQRRGDLVMRETVFLELGVGGHGGTGRDETDVDVRTVTL